MISGAALQGLLRDEIARMIMYLSKADAFWYIVNSETSQYGSLCKRFGMLQRDCEALLVAAKLGQIRGGEFQIVIVPIEWDNFIQGGHFVFLNQDKPQWIPPNSELISMHSRMEVLPISLISKTIGAFESVP